jgi:hypothetical protein
MPDNAGYMFAAYIAAAAVFGGYVVSLILRSREMSRREVAMGTVRPSANAVKSTTSDE